MKYIVTGNCSGAKVYWNSDRKGWYTDIWYASKYDDVERANTACEIAEVTLTVEMVNGITFEKIKG